MTGQTPYLYKKNGHETQTH